MAISLISRTNTIDEWRIQTNQTATSFNNLETGDFTKSNGTLYLTSNSSLIITANGTGLQVSNSALFQSNVTVGRDLAITQNLAVTQSATIGTGLNVASGQVTLATLNVNDPIVYLNADKTSGSPSENAGLTVKRGSSSDVYLRWNETTDKWEFTNDGSSFGDIAGTYQVTAAGSYANSAYTQANTATTNAATADQRAVTSGSYANSAYSAANTADQRAVTSGSYANSAYTAANTADQRAVTSGSYANSAYTSANTKYASAGGLISGAVQVSGHVTPSTHNTYNIGNTTYKFATIYATTFSGTATSAQYADLAEKYTTDEEYPVGTVIVVNPDEGSEATKSTRISQLVLGVISEKPAYLMNSEAPGQAIALRGRVPVRVIGPVRKGETLVSCPDGKAMVGSENKFAIALESAGNEETSIEVVIL